MQKIVRLEIMCFKKRSKSVLRFRSAMKQEYAFLTFERKKEEATKNGTQTNTQPDFRFV